MEWYKWVNPKTLKKRYLQGVVLIAGLGIGIRHLALTPGLLLNSAVILGEAFNLLSLIWVDNMYYVGWVRLNEVMHRVSRAVSRPHNGAVQHE